MNAPTLIIIIVIAILMVFALRRAYRVFSLKDDCCGGGSKTPKAKKVAAVTVEDADEANYPYSLDVKVKGMTCEKCVERVQNALNAQPGTWATVDLASGTAHILAKSPIVRDAVERAVEDAGYYVSHRN
ncbi:heavy metal-associated domain-containing protein [uncultured Ellagibacter sp.]|uniref:heavy-metal-associated domain-containing protein n=1 Tax=uncultured Ellagibacter sp. TaxID=2137580 RepID=UPI00261E0305|nr:heavy metal-associated domain-containing protein [uncultured Ellagibacter sp.]